MKVSLEKTKKSVNGYTHRTLENNWNEDRFDIKYLKESRPLPSQVQCMFILLSRLFIFLSILNIFSHFFFVTNKYLILIVL